MPVKSYAWGKRLDAEVPDTGTVEVMTPGFHGPENYQTDDTHVVMGGTVIPGGSYDTAWAGDFTSVTVTNGTGHSWPPGETVYVTVAGKTVDPADIQGTLEALDARVSANEAALTAQAGQIDANTSAIATLDARVTAIEGAAFEAGYPPPVRPGGPKSSLSAATADHAKAQEEKHDDGTEGDEEHSRHKGNPREKPGTPHWKDEPRKR